MTKIEWTERTWNPIVGCSIVSPGCTNCYAMRMAYRLERMAQAKFDRSGPDHFGDNQIAPAQPISHYSGLTKVVNGNVVWTGKLALAPERTLLEPLRRRKPTMWFVNSMGDLFHEDVSDEWIDRVYAVMALCPQHTFQCLTKRADRMKAYCSAPDVTHRVARAIDALLVDLERPSVTLWQNNEPTTRSLVSMIKDRKVWPDALPWPLPNVWLGVSAERQQEYDARKEDLRNTPAAIRFFSFEPLLGPIEADYLADWCIAGGESGPDARPMHPDWARSIRDQCAASGTTFFFKQWGSWGVVYDRDREDPDWRRCDLVATNTPNGQWLNIAGGQGFHGDRVVRVIPMSKTRPAGRLLDGREHSDMPRTEAHP